MSSTAATISKNVGSSVRQKIKTRPSFSNPLKKQDGALQVVQSQFKRVGKSLQPETIKGYSTQKKIFMIAAAILLIAVVANIAIAKYFNSRTETVTVATDTLASLEKKISDANAALLYGDEAQAQRLLSEVRTELNNLGQVDEEQRSQVDKIRSDAQTLDNKLNNIAEANVETLGTLSSSDNLIVSPEYFATESNRTVISYDREAETVADNKLRASEPIALSSYAKGSQIVIFNGSELLIWDYDTGVIGGAFSTDVPSQGNARGLTFYNNRAYLLDRGGKRVMRYTMGASNFSEPTVSISNISEATSASDLAIDGSIYIAAGGTILKYNSGTKQDFNVGVSNLGNTTKLYTENGFTNLYVLDPAGKLAGDGGHDPGPVEHRVGDGVGPASVLHRRRQAAARDGRAGAWPVHGLLRRTRPGARPARRLQPLRARRPGR